MNRPCARTTARVPSVWVAYALLSALHHSACLSDRALAISCASDSDCATGLCVRRVCVGSAMADATLNEVAPNDAHLDSDQSPSETLNDTQLEPVDVGDVDARLDGAERGDPSNDVTHDPIDEPPIHGTSEAPPLWVHICAERQFTGYDTTPSLTLHREDADIVLYATSDTRLSRIRGAAGGPHEIVTLNTACPPPTRQIRTWTMGAATGGALLHCVDEDEALLLAVRPDFNAVWVLPTHRDITQSSAWFAPDGHLHLVAVTPDRPAWFASLRDDLSTFDAYEPALPIWLDPHTPLQSVRIAHDVVHVARGRAHQAWTAFDAGGGATRLLPATAVLHTLDVRGASPWALWRIADAPHATLGTLDVTRGLLTLQPAVDIEVATHGEIHMWPTPTHAALVGVHSEGTWTITLVNPFEPEAPAQVGLVRASRDARVVASQDDTFWLAEPHESGLSMRQLRRDPCP